MNQVTFDEESVSVPSRPQQTKAKGGLYKVVIDLGLAKDEQQASIVLIIIAIVAIAIGIAYPFFFA